MSCFFVFPIIGLLALVVQAVHMKYWQPEAYAAYQRRNAEHYKRRVNALCFWRSR